MSAGLTISSKTKNKLFRKWMKSRSTRDKLKYKSYRKVFKRVAEIAEVLYYKQQFDTRAISVKQLWTNLNKVFNYKKNKSNCVITDLKVGNKFVTEHKDICNGLNTYYCSVGNKLADLLDKCESDNFKKYCPPSNASSMYCIPAAPNEIYRIIVDLKKNKSHGADNIGSKILKRCR